MTEAFGGSDADGRWSMRDAYDALEAAQASDTLAPDNEPNPDCAPEDDFADILAFEKALPTQTYRSEHQRSEEHTSELQSLMRISYAVFCLKKKTEKSRIKRITK